MTPDQLRTYMRALGLSQSGLARLVRLGLQDNPRSDSRTVRRWLSGKNPIPGPVVVILEAYADNDGVLETIDAFRRR